MKYRKLKYLICLISLLIFGSNTLAQDKDFVKGFTKSNFRLDYINLIPTDSFAIVSKPTWLKLFESYNLLNEYDTLVSSYKLKTNKQIDSLYAQINFFKKKVKIQDEIEREQNKQIIIRNIVIDNQKIEITNLNHIIDDKNKIIIKQGRILKNKKWLVGGAGVLGFILGVWVVK